MCRGMLLIQICENGFMPEHETVRMWALNDINGFGEQFDLALQMQSHAFFEMGVQMGTSPDLANLRNVNRDRLAMDTYFKAAGKVSPRLYGDRVEAGGGIIVNINTTLGNGESEDNDDKQYTINLEKRN